MLFRGLLDIIYLQLLIMTMVTMDWRIHATLISMLLTILLIFIVIMSFKLISIIDCFTYYLIQLLSNH
jgi:hypothetical protein